MTRPRRDDVFGLTSASARSDCPGWAADIIGIGASAGGLRALTVVLAALPATFPAAIAIVQHLDPRHRSVMADILNRLTPLPVTEACEGTRATAGAVYTARPDWHLVVNPDGTFSLSGAPPVNHVRPSVDCLFESLAASYGPHAIGVILSGSGRDGAAGVKAIKAHGGLVLIQDERTSDHFGMPGAALQTHCVDLVLPLDRIAPTLISLFPTRALS